MELDHLQHLATAVLEAEGVRGDVEVSLVFLDQEAMAELNSHFLDRQGPTDVLAFPIDDEPVEGGRSPDAGGSGPGWVPARPQDLPRLLGDVAICPEVAWRNARAEGVAYEDEMALLVVHGLLHLQGMDHEDEDEASSMEAREQELLERFHRPRASRAAPQAAAPGPAAEPS